MNWGYRILFVYLLFVIGMLTLVYKCTKQNTELVAENYYDEEMKYQNQFVNMQNAASALVVCNPVNSNAIDLMFPADFTNRVITGQITFYRPDNKQKDFTMQIKNENGKMRVVTDKLSSGYWRFTIAWSCDGKEYLQEEKIMLP
ncbi:MAG: hypothetical protein RL516_1513 [Bacteroidota bacterium]|jgi:hypothetical protein